jgi:hypothetical protein
MVISPLRQRWWWAPAATALLALAALACSASPKTGHPAPSEPEAGAGGGEEGGRGGSGGGAGRGPTGGSGGSRVADAAPAVPDVAPPTDGPLPRDGGAGANAGAAGDSGPTGDGSVLGPPAAGQGPVAAGTIAYSQDFESGKMDGLGLSPSSITPDRVVVVDDPLGQRGKVLRIEWRVGDDFRSAPQFRPKTFVSNNSAFNYNSGDKVSYAWGYMTESTYIGATLAQNITGGDPIWMIQGRDQGIMDVVPGLVRLPVRLEAKKWYDFRVDVDYLPGGAGLIEMYINGQKVFTHRGGLPSGSRAHWDGGIYLTGFGQTGAGNTTPRTVYFSNLSCGRR